MTYTYKYPKADITVDAVVFGLDPDDRFLKVLLIRRGTPTEPFYDHWALPGGFVEFEKDATLEVAVRRELLEETGLEPAYVEQLYTFGDIGRDPRGRTFTVAYLTLVRPQDVTVRAGDDAKEARWFRVDQLPALAFDHDKILAYGLERLRSKVRWRPVGIELLPEKFTLTDLQRVYEAILNKPLDKANFRKKVLKLGVLKDTGKKAEAPGRPPASLYRFDRLKYEKVRVAGIDFEV